MLTWIMGRYLGLGTAFLVAILAAFFGINYKVPEAIVFAIFLSMLAVWFGLYNDEALVEEKLTKLKIFKLLILSFIEIFILFSFVNVIMFSDFYFSDLLKLYFFVRVFILTVFYWFTYFVVKMFSQMRLGQV